MTFVAITLAISSCLLVYCAFLSYQLGKRLLEAIAHLHITTQDMIRAMNGKSLLTTLDKEIKRMGRGLRVAGEPFPSREEAKKAGK